MENNEENERASRIDSAADSKEKTDTKEQGSNRRRFPRRTRAKSHSENRKRSTSNDKADEKKHKNTEGERRTKNPTRDDLNLMSDLKKGVEINDKIQQSRVATHHSLDKNNTGNVRITPLGGLGEIGANITVIETENSASVVDVGMSFPEAGMHGVDILVPDFSYLEII
ncbi:MAG: ribonuclease J, partial [Helicobacter sp.]|nr:ribonuclease J [Helicobacter sp.]